MQFSLSVFKDEWFLAQNRTPVIANIESLLPNVDLAWEPAGIPLWEMASTLPDAPTNFQQLEPQLVSWSDAAPNRKQFVLLITDGVRSLAGAFAGSAEVRPFDLAECTRIKETGATLVVLYTKYVKTPNNTTWTNHMGDAKYLQIEPNLEKCPTNSTFFLKGDSPAEIEARFTDAFTAILRAARRPILTQ